jgi:hypothetical protein
MGLASTRVLAAGTRGRPRGGRDHKTQLGPPRGPFPFDHEATRLYCENDHTIEHNGIGPGTSRT